MTPTFSATNHRNLADDDEDDVSDAVDPQWCWLAVPCRRWESRSPSGHLGGHANLQQELEIDPKDHHLLMATKLPTPEDEETEIPNESENGGICMERTLYVLAQRNADGTCTWRAFIQRVERPSSTPDPQKTLGSNALVSRLQSINFWDDVGDSHPQQPTTSSETKTGTIQGNQMTHSSLKSVQEFTSTSAASTETRVEFEFIEEPWARTDQDCLTSDSEDEQPHVNRAVLRLGRNASQCARYGAQEPLWFVPDAQAERHARSRAICPHCHHVPSFELQVFPQVCLYHLQRAGCDVSIWDAMIHDDIVTVDIYSCPRNCSKAVVFVQAM